MSSPTLTSRLLVSSPSMDDRNFDRTVVFMLEHGDDGAAGLVINRPSPIELGDAVPRWLPFAAPPAVVFLGGPVGQGAVVNLARMPDASTSDVFSPVLGEVGILDASSDPAALAAPPAEVRVFTGYSGWGPGQLEHELEAGAWLVLDARPTDPLCAEPDQLWTEVLKRRGGVEAMARRGPHRNWLN